MQLNKGTVLLNCEQESFPNIVDKIVHDFVDSGHLNKENREMMKRTLMSDHRTSNTTFSVSGLTRKKSTMSEFFPPPIGSRRQSTFTGDVPTHYSSTNNNSETMSVSTSRKNSYAQFETTTMTNLNNNNNNSNNNSNSSNNAAQHSPSSSSINKPPKDKKLSMSEFNLQNKVNYLKNLF